MRNEPKLDPIIAEVLLRYEVDAERFSVSSGSDLIASSSSMESLEGPLAEHIYKSLHSGMDDLSVGLSREDIIDRELQEAIIAATPASDSYRSLEVLERRASSVIVRINGIRVELRTDQYTQDPGSEEVSIGLPPLRPFISPGFSYYESADSLGFQAQDRIYVSLASPVEVPSVWTALHRFTPDISRAYHAKITSSKILYPRRDAVVIYLPRVDEERLLYLGAQLSAAIGKSGTVSKLVREIAPGIGYAHEPNDSTLTGQKTSFGQHRSRVLARAALLREPRQPNPRLVEEVFTLANIDPSAIHLNFQ